MPFTWPPPNTHSAMIDNHWKITTHTSGLIILREAHPTPPPEPEPQKSKHPESEPANALGFDPVGLPYHFGSVAPQEWSDWSLFGHGDPEPYGGRYLKHDALRYDWPMKQWSTPPQTR
jgi:hypothetical protein